MTTRKGALASKELQWQIDERTIRDCPGNRTELEWRAAVDGDTVSIDKDGALIVVVSTQALVELLKRAGALL